MKKLLSLIFVTTILTFSASVLADYAQTSAPLPTDSWYKVEVLVFSYKNPVATNEFWPNLTALPNTQNAITLLPSADNDLENGTETPNQTLLYQILPSENLQLNTQEKRLIRNGNYNILLHEAWIQQINEAPMNETPAIHIQGGENYGSNASSIWQIDGTLKISKTNYFNIKTNLVLTEKPGELPSNLQNTPESPYGSNLASFELKGSDRMRSNEPYYFDHPLFGMVVLINKYQPNARQ